MKFGNFIFIIDKNRNKTCMQPILQLNSTSFMFNNIFCEMNIKKVIHSRRAGGNGGTVLISSWKCNYSIYLDIQVYCILGYLSDIHSFMPSIGSWCVIIHVSIIHVYIDHSPEKSCFQSLSHVSDFWFLCHVLPTPPSVFNLQALDWVHCEEETDAYYQLSWNTYKILFFYKFLKFVLSTKIRAFQKIP